MGPAKNFKTYMFLIAKKPNNKENIQKIPFLSQSDNWKQWSESVRLWPK